MGTASVAVDVQQAYQSAFEEFSRRVRDVQHLTSHPNPDQAAIDSALLNLERARVVYDRCRDALAEELLPPSARDKFLRAPSGPSDVRAERVRGVAALLWEAAGRPEGTADEDWRRAEEIVRQAPAA